MASLEPRADTPTKRVVIVTGASSGIGLALAERAARGGFDVLAVGRRSERLERLRYDVAGAIGHVEPLAIDVTSAGAAETIARAAMARFGRIDILVNNAGGVAVGPTSAQSDASLREQVDTHVVAPLALVRETADELARRRGQVFFVGSGVARIPVAGLGAYPGVKAAVRNFTRSVRGDLGPRGIAVTYVDPGAVATEFMTRAGFAGPPSFVAVTSHDVARRIYEAFTTRPAVVNGVPWQTALVAIGEALPTLTDRLLGLAPGIVGGAAATSPVPAHDAGYAPLASLPDAEPAPEPLAVEAAAPVAAVEASHLAQPMLVEAPAPGAPAPQPVAEALVPETPPAVEPPAQAHDEQPPAAETHDEQPPVAEKHDEQQPVAETHDEQPPVAETHDEQPPIAEAAGVRDPRAEDAFPDATPARETHAEAAPSDEPLVDTMSAERPGDELVAITADAEDGVAGPSAVRDDPTPATRNGVVDAHDHANEAPAVDDDAPPAFERVASGRNGSSPISGNGATPHSRTPEVIATTPATPATPAAAPDGVPTDPGRPSVDEFASPPLAAEGVVQARFDPPAHEPATFGATAYDPAPHEPAPDRASHDEEPGLSTTNARATAAALEALAEMPPEKPGLASRLFGTRLFGKRTDRMLTSASAEATPETDGLRSPFSSTAPPMRRASMLAPHELAPHELAPHDLAPHEHAPSELATPESDDDVVVDDLIIPADEPARAEAHDDPPAEDPVSPWQSQANPWTPPPERTAFDLTSAGHEPVLAIDEEPERESTDDERLPETRVVTVPLPTIAAPPATHDGAAVDDHDDYLTETVDPESTRYEQALAVVARRMRKLNLSHHFLARLLVPGDVLFTGDVALRWAGMPNKNERALTAEALRALADAGYLEQLEDERYRVLLSARD